MYPVQEHVNTLGIDCSIQRLTEYVNEYERNSFQPRMLQLNLDNTNRLPHSKYPDRKKSGNVLVHDSNPQPSACKADTQTIRPPAPADKPH